METIGGLLSHFRATPEPERQAQARKARREQVIENLAEAPATLFIELNRPFGFLFSQGTFFARPFLGFFLPAGDVEAAAEALDDPSSLDCLLRRIEELSAEESRGKS